MSLNDQIVAESLDHQEALGSQANDLVASATEILNKYDSRIEHQLERIKVDVSASVVTDSIVNVKKINAAAYESIEEQLVLDMVSTAEDEVDFQVQLMQGKLPKGISLALLPEGTINRIVELEVINGYRLHGYIDGMRTGRNKRLEQSIRRAASVNQGSTALLKEVMGTKVLHYMDGVLAVSRRSLDQIVRTIQVGVVTNTRTEFYKRNDEIVIGMKWVSTLDKKTSSICQERDGMIFPIDEGPRPPAHLNCRSEMIPVMKEARG